MLNSRSGGSGLVEGCLDGEDFREIGIEGRLLLGLSKRDISVLSEDPKDGGDSGRFSDVA